MVQGKKDTDGWQDASKKGKETMAMTLEEKRARRAERKANKERRAKIEAENQAIVSTGVCPKCGEKLHRNLAITGWWQCGSYGADGFRRDGKKAADVPQCSFQCFV